MTPPTPLSILFTGSSSGGHLVPGLAVAEQLRLIGAECHTPFITAGRPVEEQIFQGDSHIERIMLNVPALAQLKKQPCRTLYDGYRSMRESQALIRSHRPRVVVGLGGMQMVPIVRAAALEKIPVILLEQNSVPGRATQFAARYARRICLSFEGSESHFRDRHKCVLVGNPLRQSLVDRFTSTTVSRGEDDNQSASQKTLLILGGSQGATAVNNAVLDCVTQNRDQFQGWQMLHQTGASQLSEIQDRYRSLGIDHSVQPYFDDMPRLYQQATIVVSRAGATTLAELALAQKATVVIPYPNSARDHQEKNAAALDAANALRVVLQTSGEQTAEALWRELQELMNSPTIRHELASKIGTFAHPDAARMVVDEIRNFL